VRALSRYCRVCLDLAAIAIGLLFRDMTTGVSGSDSREGAVDKVVRKIMELGRRACSSPLPIWRKIVTTTARVPKRPQMALHYSNN
jgi:hypothetical protein